MLKQLQRKFPQVINQFCTKMPQVAITRDTLLKHNWLNFDENHKRSEQTHKSDAEQRINKIPIIMVDTDVVRCIGGTQIGAGHPQVYINVNLGGDKPATCKWCGLRYMKKKRVHH